MSYHYMKWMNAGLKETTESDRPFICVYCAFHDDKNSCLAETISDC